MSDLPSENQKSCKQQHDTSDSSTRVNFRLDEPRRTVGFKCNINLWNAFVPYCKANFGSVCHVLEPIIVALLTSKVNLSTTIKPLRIENLNVERAVKRVRRYSVEKVDGIEIGSKCCAVCGGAVFARVNEPGGVRFLCEVDFGKVRSRLLGWKELGNE
jgi:hypothetical protein